jgi:hypothetical protein
MSAEYLRIDSMDDLARAIVLAEAQGSIGFVHLARALAAGRIAFQPLPPEMSASRFKQFARLTTDRPTIVVIGDDDGFDRGPGGWRLAERAVAWAKTTMLHGAGAELPHYEAAVRAAQLVRRCLIVECSSATLPAWEALVRTAPHRPVTLVVRPRGGVHPLPMARESMH